MATHVLFALFLAVHAALGSEYRQEGLMDKLSHGMKFASDLLASDSIATKVAEFVVRAFQTGSNAPVQKRRPSPLPYVNDAYVEDSRSQENLAEDTRPNYQVNETPNPMAPLKYLVKLLGLQPNQISAVAVNALVFVAQMISTFLAGPTRPTKLYHSDNPTNWILNKNSRTLQDLITRARNESILDDIDELIQEQGEETGCVRLLICKMTPFVRKMQHAVFGNETSFDSMKFSGANGMYRHLPSAADINESSDICERRHADCDLNEQ